MNEDGIINGVGDRRSKRDPKVMPVDAIPKIIGITLTKCVDLFAVLKR